MKIKNTSFVDYCYALHKELGGSETKNIPETESTKNSFFSKISPNISEEKLQEIFRDNIDRTISKYVKEFAVELAEYRKLEGINFYEISVTRYLTFMILWCIDKKTDLNMESLNKICQCAFIGTVGYRLIDLQQDHNLLDSKTLYLGFYLINISEEILAELFPFKETTSIIKKHSNLYNKIEFKEKQHRWKGCPFTWENVEELGHKAAPIYSVFELIFKLMGFNEEKTTSLLKALNNVAASTQLCDDISDAYEDLSNGFETLVMSGFYNTHPDKEDINLTAVENFINSERLKLFYEKNTALLNEASKIFSKYDEYLFAFLLETHRSRFLEGFGIDNN